jgi:hypothetical protein
VWHSHSANQINRRSLPLLGLRLMSAVSRWALPPLLALLIVEFLRLSHIHLYPLSRGFLSTRLDSHGLFSLIHSSGPCGVYHTAIHFCVVPVARCATTTDFCIQLSSRGSCRFSRLPAWTLRFIHVACCPFSSLVHSSRGLMLVIVSTATDS